MCLLASGSVDALSRRLRAAFSLLELVIVLLILIVLASLALVAVQAARESARRTQCQNNLKQNMLAFMTIVHRQNQFPLQMAVEIQPDNPREYAVWGNPLVLIAREHSFPCRAASRKIWVSPPLPVGDSDPPPTLRCPSSNVRLGYRLNFGVHPLFRFLDRNEPGTLIQFYKPPATLASVTDGLSNTCMMAERMSDMGGKRFPSAVASSNSAKTPDDMRPYCNTAYQHGQVATDSAEWWSTHFHPFGYDHSQPPNSREVDCTVYQRNPWPTFFFEIASRSEHSGGVSCGLLDGSVRWVDNGIDASIWKALGTMAGNDAAGPFD